MGTGLGQAIGNLFARIAAALASGSVGSVSPLPPSQPTPTPTPTPPGGSTTPYPEDGYVGGSPAPFPAGPLPEVIVPVTPSPPPSTTTPSGCPILSFSDRLAIQALSQQDSSSIITPSDIYIYPAPKEHDVASSVGLGIPVEWSDVFRFRAFGSAGAIPVSFFGRVQRINGDIIPFNHVLTTDASGTIYTTMPQPGPGLLLGVSASVPINSITSGSVSAVAEIGRLQGGTFIPHTALFSGQLDDLTPLGNAGSSPIAPVGQGTLIQVAFTNGVTNFTQGVVTPSTGKQMRFTAIKFDYVASATAGNRQGTIQLIVGGSIIWECLTDQLFTASQEMVIRASMGGGVVSPASAIPSGFREMNMSLPESLYFSTPVTVLGGVFGTQAGDKANTLTVSREEI